MTAFTTARFPAPIGYRPTSRFGTRLASRRCSAFATTNFPIAAGPGSIACILTIGPRVLAALDAHFRHRVPYDVEYRLRTKSGEYRWFSGRGSARWDAAGNPTRFAGAVRDITERKQIEEDLRREQRLLRQLLNVHERERQLFAYEIHDGLSQQVTGSLMHLEASAQAADPSSVWARQEFEYGVRLLREAVGEARRLLSGLRPPILDESGVVAGIEYLVNEVRQFIAEVTVFAQRAIQASGAPSGKRDFSHRSRSPEQRQSARPRPGMRWCRSSKLRGNCRLEITDDGIGFDPSRVGDDHFGLQGIRERARLLDGRATIDSTAGRGTRITVEFPLPPAVEEWSSGNE